MAAVKWLWDFEQGGRIPSETELEESLLTVGLSRVKVNGDSLSLVHPGIQLDLGGIAKGYIVDQMVEFLKQGGVEAGLINAGGDIYSFGKKPDGKDWVIGLRHPRLNKTLVIKTISLSAVATSGDYERYFMQDGVRYHHIIDPKTGYPAKESISVTVWTNSAMDADALATTIFVLGRIQGILFAESMEDVETLIFYEEDGAVKNVMSSGVRDIVPL